MNDYDKIFKELQEKYTVEEIAEAYMIPKTLSPEERKKGDEEFLKLRLEMRKHRTQKQMLLSEIMRLRIKIENYLKEETYLENFSFAGVINDYIHILEKTKKDFVEDIGISIAQFNKIIQEKETPSIDLIYRLEKHTDSIIPALYWWKIVALEIEYNIDKREVKRIETGKNVRNYYGQFSF